MNEFFGKLMGLPLLASTHGKDVDLLILYLHYMMGILFVGWTAYFFYAIWRFRASRNPKADYIGAKTHASSWIEVGVAVAEMVLLFFMAVPYWAKSVESFPDEKSSTVLRVIAQQFNWTARYPGADGVFGKADIALASAENPLGLFAKDPKRKTEDPQGADDVIAGGSEIAVPVNKPVIAHMTSLDVIHSFKVVPLRVTQDCNPGMDIPIHFIPTITNTYLIQCSQLCGNGHYSMKGTFKVVGANEYAAWLESKPKAGAKAQSFE